MSSLLHLNGISCVIGFVGDALLQVGTKLNLGGPTGWGLKPYFKQHGSVESLFIAGGMMTIFYVIYLYLLPFQVNYINLAIYGIVLDLIFRKTRLFPSLDGYYKHLNYFWSGFWGAVPLMMPLFAFDLLSIQR
jgi:hypothetical protein